jgi:hypothetical protein
MGGAVLNRNMLFEHFNSNSNAFVKPLNGKVFVDTGGSIPASTSFMGKTVALLLVEGTVGSEQGDGEFKTG